MKMEEKRMKQRRMEERGYDKKKRGNIEDEKKNERRQGIFKNNTEWDKR
jgi:hypothetical protein